MSGSAKGTEPSMDEILASIKQIISEEPASVTATQLPAQDVAAKDIDASLDNILKDVEKQVVETPVRASNGHAAKTPAPEVASTSQRAERVAKPSGLLSALNGVLAPNVSAPPLPEDQAASDFVAGAPKSDGAAPLNSAGYATAGDRQVSAAASEAPVLSSGLESIRLRARRAAGLLERAASGNGDKAQVNGAASIAAATVAAAPAVAKGAVQASTAVQSSPGAGLGNEQSRGRELETKVVPAAIPDALKNRVEVAPQAASKAVEVPTAGEAKTMASEGSLEDAIKDLLRPMLNKWLDQKLPDIVEKVVREEIAKRNAGGPDGGS